MGTARQREDTPRGCGGQQAGDHDEPERPLRDLSPGLLPAAERRGIRGAEQGEGEELGDWLGHGHLALGHFDHDFSRHAIDQRSEIIVPLLR